MEYTLLDFINSVDMLRGNSVVLFNNNNKNEIFKYCWLNREFAENELNLVEEYMKLQCTVRGKEYYKGMKYVLSFVNGNGNNSFLYGIYEVRGLLTKDEAIANRNKLKRVHSDMKRWYEWVGGLNDVGEKQYYYDLIRLHEFDDLADKLKVKYKDGKTHLSCQYTDDALNSATIFNIPPELEKKYF